MIVHKIGSCHKFHPMGCFDVRSCSQLQSVRTMDLISHHHLLGTVVIRDYDLLSHKYCLRHASLLAPYQLLCWALFGTRKHALWHENLPALWEVPISIFCVPLHLIKLF